MVDAIRFCCINNPMDETKRESPTYPLMELSLWPYTYRIAIAASSDLFLIIEDESKSSMATSAQRPIVANDGHLLTDDSPLNISTTSASSSAIDDVSQWRNLEIIRHHASHAPMMGAAGRWCRRRPIDGKVARPAAPDCSYGCPWP